MEDASTNALTMLASFYKCLACLQELSRVNAIWFDSAIAGVCVDSLRARPSNHRQRDRI
jgi:hypothetical protein